jgi:mono/diheme cytochrome c family protein
MRWGKLILSLSVSFAPLPAWAQTEPSIEHGRYLVQIAGCNDCHTAGYAMTGGDAPEEEWLKGDSLGWRGPWGTTYAVNLRLRLSEMTEDEWVEYARVFETRPPMPWFALHDMTETDIRSLYRYITSFEEKGEPAPEFVPPDQEPEGPYVQFPAPPN